MTERPSAISTSTFEFPPYYLTNVPTPIPPAPPAGLPATWTPFATYSPDKASQMITDFYEHNPCKLPCWWNITPGKTGWNEAWQFLARFAKNQPPWETVLKTSVEYPGLMPFEVILYKHDQNYPNLEDLWFFISIKTFTVEYISINTGNVVDYTIPHLLSTYGRPENIYIRGGNSPAGYTYNLYLDYPQYSFISTHQSISSEEQGNFINTCFQDSTTLFLWPRSKVITLPDTVGFVPEVFTDTIPYIYPINKISDMTIDTFYNQYVGQDGNVCIDFYPKVK